MNLGEYLGSLDKVVRRDEQQKWFLELEERGQKGLALFSSAEDSVRKNILDEFRNRVRTEEIKAWYSEPEGDSLFQGTSVSSLTIPYEIPDPLLLSSITELEDNIAEAYIELHDKHAGKAKEAILENIDDWIREGLYYGIVIGSKVISQAFGLTISHSDVIFEVDGYCVDPHEITSYPHEVREAYFDKCKKKVDCFNGLDLEQNELEASLVLADISKPKIDKYEDKILLAPVRCNEIAALLAEKVADKIREKSSGRIQPRSLAVVIYDTDTPYTYHEVMGYNNFEISQVLPGLTVLGASGTIGAFRWLYTYRLSLIAQKMQKGSIYSEVHRRFIPFTFFGVLVPRDAEILLDMDNLHRLRYKGNLSPDMEFLYMVSALHKNRTKAPTPLFWKEFRKKHFLAL
jgi:hypothetical protein